MEIIILSLLCTRSLPTECHFSRLLRRMSKLDSERNPSTRVVMRSVPLPAAGSEWINNMSQWRQKQYNGSETMNISPQANDNREDKGDEWQLGE